MRCDKIRYCVCLIITPIPCTLSDPHRLLVRLHAFLLQPLILGACLPRLVCRYKVGPRGGPNEDSGGQGECRWWRGGARAEQKADNGVTTTASWGLFEPAPVSGSRNDSRGGDDYDHRFWPCCCCGCSCLLLREMSVVAAPLIVSWEVPREKLSNCLLASSLLGWLFLSQHI
jgi:hypothetical protein